MHLSLIELWSQMAAFARGIVAVLAIMSVWSLSIAFKKWWDLRLAQSETRGEQVGVWMAGQLIISLTLHRAHVPYKAWRQPDFPPSDTMEA